MLHARRVLVGTLLLIAAAACSATRQDGEEDVGESSAPLRREVTSVADTFLRELQPNHNEGTNSILRLTGLGDNRSLVRFDDADIASLGDGIVRLELTISANGNGWGPSGRALAVHRMTKAWTEAGATWNCAIDSNTNNIFANCSGATDWQMGFFTPPANRPWADTPTATVVLQNSQTGVLSFDVSDDVRHIQDHSRPNFGWVIRKVDESLPGHVELSSREGNHPPKLSTECVGDGGSCQSEAGADASIDASSDTGAGHQDAATDARDAGEDASAPDSGGDAGGGGCTPSNCTAPDACHVASCTSTGCQISAASAGTVCGASANACVTVATCDGAGTCVAGSPIICASAGACEVAYCDPALGCTTTPAGPGTSCSNGDRCDGDEQCDGMGACQAGTPPIVDDANACTADACDPAVGVTHTNLPFGDTAPSDANACNGIETCDGNGHVVAGPPPTLDDGNVCTIDACSPATGVSHTPVPSCDPTPVRGDAPFETRASVLGRLVDANGQAVTAATFTVWNDKRAGSPRADVAATVAGDGSFRLRFTTFPDAEPARTPPHRLMLQIDAPGTLGASREAYVHVGDAVDLGAIRLVAEDTKVTNIGPEGGTATDSQGLASVVIPAGALTTTTPITITPLVQREDFPAPLPDTTITMYGVELRPNGTTFNIPATLRVSNYRNLPTGLRIPLGSYDEVEGRWTHDGMATWDGSAFSVAISHFSEKDINDGAVGDLVASYTRGSDPDRGQSNCGVGSAWQMSGGSVVQSFPLPSMQVKGTNLSFSLHYSSGLAGSRSLGAAPDDESDVVHRASLKVSMASSGFHTFCTASGGGAPSSSTPGTCSSVIGTCGGGGVLVTTVALAGSRATIPDFAATPVSDVEGGSWMAAPLDETGTQLASPGYYPMVATFIAGASNGTCAGSGGTFGVSDPRVPRVQLSQPNDVPLARVERKVFVNHRFTSSVGTGWAIGEMSRVYPNGDSITLVRGTGEPEAFFPRATPTDLGIVGEMAFARDDDTGEVFIVHSDTISKLDPTSGTRTAVVSGLGISSAIHALAVARVSGSRRFVVATGTELFDIDAAGSRRSLAPRTVTGNTFSTQSSVAARGDVAFYTSGGIDDAVLYRLQLSDASPTLTAASATTGDVSLYPRVALSGVQFSGPRGLAFAPDGTLYVAEPRRHVVYRLSPDLSGQIAPTSAVDVAVGRGGGSYVTPVGERSPAKTFSINQPSRLAVSPEGYLLVATQYGVAQLDPVSQEAENIFSDNGHDELLVTLAGMSGPYTESSSVSFVALSPWSVVGRTLYDPNPRATRIDVEPLSSERDPTRTLHPTGSSGFELVDTTSSQTWKYDAQGRLTEQRKRSGELDFSMTYADPRREMIDRITDAVGGQWVFGYANDKISSLTDPSGRTTSFTVDAQGDVTQITEPSGESHAFTYDRHHMVSKTSPRGDVTSYTYADNGTLATSNKPGSEAYAFEPALSTQATWDASGRPIHTGHYTDARGVTHDFVTNHFGDVEKETSIADGVTYEKKLVYASETALQRGATLTGPAETYPRRNAMLRATHRTLNGVPLSPPIQFDSLGRLGYAVRTGAHTDHVIDVTYDPQGWLLTERHAPSNVVNQYDRDAAGHVTRAFELSPDAGNNWVPNGRQSTFSWTSDGLPATATVHGVTTTFNYDAASHNLLSTSDTIGRVRSFTYDLGGNLASTSDGTASASFVYDANNRLTQSLDGFGNATTLRYTHAGCGCSEGDEVAAIHTPDLPAGVEWTMSYGPQGRLASVTDPHGFTESYEYETTGEVKKISDRLLRDTTIAHDQLGRVLSMVDTMGRRHQRSYATPSGGGWNGPTLAAGSADGSAASASLTAAPRNGDYQIGLNALDVEGYPARIALYRDATFELAYAMSFDDQGRLTERKDRIGLPIDSAALPNGGGAQLERELFAYRGPGDASVLTNRSAEGTTSVSAHGAASYNVDYDVTHSEGFGTGTQAPTYYDYTRDVAGRVQTASYVMAGFGDTFTAPSSTYTYRPDGRVGSITNADGAHAMTYDARGQLATLAADEGMYAFDYDEVGRNKRIEYPDGHLRVQVFDDLGRITSRCYEYPSDASLNRCYGASYDAVGNPVTMSDPEGSDVLTYDALDRLASVTRNGALTESYAYNALGALAVNAGAALDHQRPRLDGGGLADAAVPNTLRGQPVTLDGAGRVTSLAGVGFAFDASGQLSEIDEPSMPAQYWRFDMNGNLAWRLAGGQPEFFAYEGLDRIAHFVRDPARGYVVRDKYLYAGLDHPLRGKRYEYPAGGGAAAETLYYFELDVAGNVRRLRAEGGADLGGYRYTAFGKSVETTASVDQAVRWKARWRDSYAGLELYDMRARQWSPELGSFLRADEIRFFDSTGTLWAWPRQNPTRYSDPTGNNPVAVVAVEVAAELGAAAALFGAVDCAVNGCRTIGKIGDSIFKNEKTDDDDAPESESDAYAKPKVKKGKRGRFKSLDDVKDQDDSIRKQQAADRADGCPNKIESTKKSDQRLDNRLKNYDPGEDEDDDDQE